MIHSRKTKRRKNYATLGLEALENRVVLAGNVGAVLNVAGLLTLTGDYKSNDLSIITLGAGTTTGTKLQVTGNGSGPQATTINTGSSQIFDNVLGLTVNLAGGHDSLSLGNGTAINLRALSIDMGAGFDGLTINTVTVSGPTASPPVTVTLGTDAQNETDTLTVTSLSVSGGALTFNGGGGRDSIALTSVSAGSVTVNGGNGRDGLSLTSVSSSVGDVTVNGGLDTSDDTISLSNVTACKQLVVNAGAGDDSVNISNVTSVTLTTISLGAGDDDLSLNTFSVLATTGLTTIDAGADQDDLSITGGTVGNALTVNLGTGPNDLSLSNTNVNRGNLSILGGNDWDEVNVNNVNVQNMSVSPPAGNIIVNLGNGGNGLEMSNVLANLGAVSVTGGTGDDEIQIDHLAAVALTVMLLGDDDVVELDHLARDSGGTTAMTSVLVDLGTQDDMFTISELKSNTTTLKLGEGNNGGSLGGPSTQSTISDSSVGLFSLTSGTGNDDIALTNVSAGATTFNVGNGTNNFTVTTSTFGAVNFTGGTGVDTVLVTSSTATTVIANFLTGNNVVTVTGASANFGTLTATFTGGNNVVTVSGGANIGSLTATFGAGNDTVNLTNCSVPTVSANFGAGDDTVNAQNCTISTKLFADGGANGIVGDTFNDLGGNSVPPAGPNYVAINWENG